MAVSAGGRGAPRGLQVAARGLSRRQAAAAAAVRREAGEGVASGVGQLAGMAAAAAAAAADPAVQAAFLRAGGRPLDVGGAQQVQVALAFQYFGTVARGEVLHGGAAPGDDGFEGGGPQHRLLYVLEPGYTTSDECRGDKERFKVYLDSSAR